MKISIPMKRQSHQKNGERYSGITSVEQVVVMLAEQLAKRKRRKKKESQLAIIQFDFFLQREELSQREQMVCFPVNNSPHVCTSLIKQTTGTGPDKLTMS